MSLAEQGRKYNERKNEERENMEERDYPVVLKDVKMGKSQKGNDKFDFSFKIVGDDPLAGKPLNMQITVTPGNEEFTIPKLSATAIALGGEYFLESLSDYRDLMKVFSKLDECKPAKGVVALKYQKNDKYFDIYINEIEPVLEELVPKNKKLATPKKQVEDSQAEAAPAQQEMPLDDKPADPWS